MQAVESLTQLAASAANLVVGVATINRQAITTGLGLFQRATGGKRNTNPPPTSPQSTQPNAASITDPAIHEVSRVLQLANTLQLLFSGGPNGGPDWDRLRSKASISSLPTTASHSY